MQAIDRQRWTERERECKRDRETGVGKKVNSKIQARTVCEFVCCLLCKQCLCWFVCLTFPLSISMFLFSSSVPGLFTSQTCSCLCVGFCVYFLWTKSLGCCCFSPSLYSFAIFSLGHTQTKFQRFSIGFFFCYSLRIRIATHRAAKRIIVINDYCTTTTIWTEQRRPQIAGHTQRTTVSLYATCITDFSVSEFMRCVCRPPSPPPLTCSSLSQTYGSRNFFRGFFLSSLSLASSSFAAAAAVSDVCDSVFANYDNRNDSKSLITDCSRLSLCSRCQVDAEAAE